MSAGHNRLEPWIAADEPPPFELVNASGRGRAVLACDHASPRIPRQLGTLGVSPQDLEQHIAWDIGAAAVARGLSEILDSPLVLSGYSRLVVDCNRPLDQPTAFATLSEDVEIPGNQQLSDEERAARAEAFFWPYHEALHHLVDSRVRSDGWPVLISIHSFTPVYQGQERPWHIGIQYRWDSRLAGLVLEGLRSDSALCVGDNEPYAVQLDEDYTVPVHAERRGMPYLLVEIRQDLIASEAGARAWADRVSNAVSSAVAHPSLDHFMTPAPDVCEPRFE
ncbi:MAG: N-formylglutamate amidohydrolase [Alphaproteobacteria bacterium]